MMLTLRGDAQRSAAAGRDLIFNKRPACETVVIVVLIAGITIHLTPAGTIILMLLSWKLEAAKLIKRDWSRIKTIIKYQLTGRRELITTRQQTRGGTWHLSPPLPLLLCGATGDWIYYSIVSCGRLIYLTPTRKLSDERNFRLREKFEEADASTASDFTSDSSSKAT